MIDERTGRQVGDHGTAFLDAWRTGEAADRWPDFYAWLNRIENPEGAPGVGRAELSSGDA
jgi:hypothetical protein